MMPGMDGYQFRKEQEANPALSNIPVIIMSADAKAQSKAAALGVDGYLTKPVDVPALLELLDRFC